MSSPAGTPTRRMTRALAKIMGDTPDRVASPTPSQASSGLRKEVVVLDSDGEVDADNDSDVVLVEDDNSPEGSVVQVAAEGEVAPAEAEQEESSGEEESSDNDEDASSSSGSDESSSEEDDDDEEEPKLDESALESLLTQAYLAADAQQSKKAARAADEEIVLQLEKKEQPLPALVVPAMPNAYLSFEKDGRVTQGSSSSTAPTNAVASSSKLAPELDTFHLPAQLSKKAAKAARKANTPLGWAELPPIPDDRRKDMTKEYHALRLRNALDPKRHYKGQGSSKAVPEVFAIGKLYEPSKVLQNSTLATAASARPGSIIKDIMGDDGSRAYAKRKFGDLQAQRERNGRKKVTKKPRK